jgi:hypothetical protein
MKAPRLLRMPIQVAFLVSISIGMLGCAELKIVELAVLTSKQAERAHNRAEEISRRSYAQPINDVWTELIGVATQDHRTIVARNDSGFSLVVRYPFSWLHNRWGGTLTFYCVASDPGDSPQSTEVRVVGGATEAPKNLSAMVDDILNVLQHQLSLKRTKAQ